MITKLTDQQIAGLQTIRDRWIERGLSTERIDRNWCTTYIKKSLYPDLLRRKEPRAVIYMDSQLAAWLAVCMVSQVRSQIRSQVWSQIGSQVWLQVGSQIDSQIDSRVGSQIDSQVGSQIDSQVWSQVWSQIESQVDSQVESQIDWQVWSQVDSQVKSRVRSQVKSQVWSQVGSQVWSQIESRVKPFIPQYLLSVYNSSYFAWVDAILSIGCKLQPDVLRLFGIYADSSRVNAIYPLDEFCIISEHPTSIHTNVSGLHRDGGPALEWADHLCDIYALNGVRVPEWLAVQRDTDIDPMMFAKLDNAEVRREFVRKIGIERIAHALGGKTLDTQGTYSLIEIDLGGETGKWPYLKMLNPSIGVWHLECVDRTCRTVDAALNFRNQTTIRPEVLT